MPNGLIALPIVAGMELTVAAKTGEAMMNIMNPKKKKKGNHKKGKKRKSK